MKRIKLGNHIYGDNICSAQTWKYQRNKKTRRGIKSKEDFEEPKITKGTSQKNKPRPFLE
jgi:hypothetical protein